jgi:hypothetical protein
LHRNEEAGLNKRIDTLGDLFFRQVKPESQFIDIRIERTVL